MISQSKPETIEFHKNSIMVATLGIEPRPVANQQIFKFYNKMQRESIENCKNEVNLQKQINRNRYVNQIMRGIATYDEI